jgi:hypothetical protein
MVIVRGFEPLDTACVRRVISDVKPGGMNGVIDAEIRAVDILEIG